MVWCGGAIQRAVRSAQKITAPSSATKLRVDQAVLKPGIAGRRMHSIKLVTARPNQLPNPYSSHTPTSTISSPLYTLSKNISAYQHLWLSFHVPPHDTASVLLWWIPDPVHDLYNVPGKIHPDTVFTRWSVFCSCTFLPLLPHSAAVSILVQFVLKLNQV